MTLRNKTNPQGLKNSLKRFSGVALREDCRKMSTFVFWRIFTLFDVPKRWAEEIGIFVMFVLEGPWRRDFQELTFAALEFPGPLRVK